MKFAYKTGMVFILLLSCTAFLVSCGNTNTTSNENSTQKTTESKPSESKPSESKPSETTASTSSEKIGVAECDEYLDKYEACISGKVPEAAREQLKTSLNTTRKSWKDLAANPDTKAGLSMTCKQALETAKQTMSAYGCSW